jgi:hypothetical protein
MHSQQKRIWPPQLSVEANARATEKPLAPADSIPKSVLALNEILEKLSGHQAIDDLRAGCACASVDRELFAAAWEGARNFRDHFLLTLARQTREEWRRDVAEVVSAQPSGVHAAGIAKALDERLQVALSFVFIFLTPRHACFLADALLLAFETEMKPVEFSSELALSGARVFGSATEYMEALALGASGMHRFRPERVLTPFRQRE